MQNLKMYLVGQCVKYHLRTALCSNSPYDYRNSVTFHSEEKNSLSSQWRHNGHDGVSNHQPHHCLLNRLFRRRSKETSKLRVTGLCAGNSLVTCELPAQMARNAENVSIWWRHHVVVIIIGINHPTCRYAALNSVGCLLSMISQDITTLLFHDSLIPPLHRGCHLCASLLRTQNWPGRGWMQKGGRTIALVVQGWHTGRLVIAMDAMVAVKFWACSKQSHKGRRGGRSLTGRSKGRGEANTSSWSQNGCTVVGHWSPRKNAYCCEHCVSIWATLLPSWHHHYAPFGRLIASIQRSLWRPLCLHSATTATLQPPWQWFCLYSASFAWPVFPHTEA